MNYLKTQNEQLEELKKIVEVKTNIKDIFHNSRTRVYIYARCVFNSLARKVTFASYEELGNFSRRNHATIINSVNLYDYSVAPFKKDIFCNKYIRIHDDILASYTDEKNIEQDLRSSNELSFYKLKYKQSLKEIERLNEIIEFLYCRKTKKEKETDSEKI